jgi:peroxiredoxin
MHQAQIYSETKVNKWIVSTLQKGKLLMAKVEVNTPAPDFTLKDFYGNNISLSDFLGQKNVLIVFNRGFM